MKPTLPLLAALLCLACGCAREDWRTAELSLPPGADPARAAEAIRALDRRTPPQVTRRGDALVVRYNALNLAPKNLSYALDHL